MTRVVIAASSPAVRAGLGALLAGVPALTLLESPTTLGALADLVETVEADVVLLALEPGEALPLPLAVQPDAAGREPAVLVLGDEPTEAWASRALRAGARGVLPRTASGEQIAAAVAAVAARLVVLPEYSRGPPSVPAFRTGAPLPPVHPLTPREVEVLAMVAEGLGNKLIAVRLGISEHTVKTHVATTFGKLGVSTRAEAVAMAARLGLIML
ncbi:MAG: response regulator transcription factor [Gemmatimonadales bacterium]|nr:response regulator transcription factor [Gemmatimonadales bacterium]